MASDLPTDRDLRDQVLLAALNSHHPHQIDGIGGSQTLSNKVVIVSPSQRSDADVNYNFVQLTPNSKIVSEGGTCGNMATVVGPYAVEKGLITASSDVTDVRIFAADSKMHITARVQSPGGQVTYEGNTGMAGVDGAAAPVTLTYRPPFGNLCGALLPTGNKRDIIDGLPVTIVDAGGDVAMIFRADQVERTGYESKSELDADDALAARIELIRRDVGRLIGLGDVANQIILKPIMVAPPREQGSIAARDLTTRLGAPHRCHAAHSGSGSICLAIASVISGTVAFEVAVSKQVGPITGLDIEHPSGTMTTSVELGGINSEEYPVGVSLVRTCRKLFDGTLYVPRHALSFPP